MSKKTVYFQLFGKNFKTEVEAKSNQDAYKKVIEKTISELEVIKIEDKNGFSDFEDVFSNLFK